MMGALTQPVRKTSAASCVEDRDVDLEPGLAWRAAFRRAVAGEMVGPPSKLSPRDLRGSRRTGIAIFNEHCSAVVPTSMTTPSSPTSPAASGSSEAASKKSSRATSTPTQSARTRRKPKRSAPPECPSPSSTVESRSPARQASRASPVRSTEHGVTNEHHRNHPD